MAGDKLDGDDAVMSEVFGSDRDRGSETAPPVDDAETVIEADAEADDTAEAAAETTDDAEPKSPGRDPATGKFVPVTELVSERKKLKERIDNEARLRQEAEARAAQYERQMALLMQQQRAVQQTEIPDPVMDPEGAYLYQTQQLQEMVVSNMLDVSEFAMRAKHGDEIVDKALQAALQTGVNKHFMTQRNPYGALVDWYRRSMAMQEIGDDPAAFRKRVEEETRAKILADLKAGKLQTTAQPPQRLPGTLADATSAGSQGAHLSDEAMLAGIFGSDRRQRQIASR
jgi:hypothetical protein